MKNFLFILTLTLSINSYSNDNKCVVKINKDFVMKYMGYYEMMDALNARGYRAAYKGDSASLDLEFSLINPYLCSQSTWSLLDEVKDPLNKVVMKSTVNGAVEERQEDMFLWSYSDKRVKRKIKKLIKKLPICK